MATITSARAASPASTPSRIKSPTTAGETQTQTQAHTPTSSTRSSFEIPARNLSITSTTTTLPPAPSQRRGNRAALRDYYNLKSKPGQHPHATPPSPFPLSRTASITSTTSTHSALSTSTTTLTSADPPPTSSTSPSLSHLDSPTFTPDTYLTTLLRTSPLQTILRIESTLVSEIRNLDGERKALVYDNYSKLIAAVSTIGEMQRNMNVEGGGLREVEGLDGRMERVRGMAGELARSGGDGDGDGEEERRSERKKWRGEVKRRENVEVVKRVMGAPERLRGLLGEGREDEADEEWTFVRGCLDRWEGVKGVAEVRAQCEAIMVASDDTSSDEGGNEKNDDGAVN